MVKEFQMAKPILAQAGGMCAGSAVPQMETVQGSRLVRTLAIQILDEFRSGYKVDPRSLKARRNSSLRLLDHQKSWEGL